LALKPEFAVVFGEQSPRLKVGRLNPDDLFQIMSRFLAVSGFIKEQGQFEHYLMIFRSKAKRRLVAPKRLARHSNVLAYLAPFSDDLGIFREGVQTAHHQILSFFILAGLYKRAGEIEAGLTA
jgi:hypothetical protein